MPAAVDYYLKLTTNEHGLVRGETAALDKQGQIDISSWGWGESNLVAANGIAGQGAGRVTMEDMNFVATTSSASSALLLACATGDPVSEAVLTCRKAGAGQQDYLEVKLEDGFITSFIHAGNQNNVIPTDQFSISFSKLNITYKKQGVDGGMASAGEMSYDLRAGRST